MKYDMNCNDSEIEMFCNSIIVTPGTYGRWVTPQVNISHKYRCQPDAKPQHVGLRCSAQTRVPSKCPVYIRCLLQKLPTWTSTMSTNRIYQIQSISLILNTIMDMDKTKRISCSLQWWYSVNKKIVRQM